MESNQTRRGRLVVLSGPSGSGKGTVLAGVLERRPLPLTLSVSACTRAPRSGEVHGREYYFLSPEDFQARRQRGEFLECAQVFGHWYGTLRSEVEGRLARGEWVVLEIDVQGFMALCEQYPDVVSIFLKTPSLEEYEQRLRGRGTEEEQAIRRRLETAHHELSLADRYRYQVVNDHVDRAVNELCLILQAEGDKVHA